jgi:hypothetical protein
VIAENQRNEIMAVQPSTCPDARSGETRHNFRDDELAFDFLRVHISPFESGITEYVREPVFVSDI